MGSSFFLHAAKGSWQLLLLAIFVGGALFGVRNVPDVESLPLDLITGVALGVLTLVGVVSAIVGIVGSLTRPLERAEIMRHAGVGLGAWAVVIALGVGGFVFVQQTEARANARAREAYEKELAAIEGKKLDPATESVQISAALARAAQSSKGEQQEMFESASSGMAARVEPLKAYQQAWAAFEEAGGVDPAASPLKTRKDIEARRALLKKAVMATASYREKWNEIVNGWRRLEHNSLMQAFVNTIVRKQTPHMRKLDCREAASEELGGMLELFDSERGKWKLVKEEPVFRRKRAAVRYSLHQERLAKIGAEIAAIDRGELSATTVCKADDGSVAAATETASPENGEASPTPSLALPNLQPVEASKAVAYANSYITLIRRGSFDEAYRYMPDSIARNVSPQEHAIFWQRTAGPGRTSLAVGESRALGEAIAYAVQIPDRASVSVAIVQIDGKIYAVPEEFLPQ